MYLQPLGAEVTAADAAIVKRWLEQTFALEVKILDRIDLPRRAYYKPRHRYRADKLLDTLRGRGPADAWRVMGLTAVDISTTKAPYDDWGVMGLGEIGGKTSVLSLFRCKKGARDAAHSAERLGKVAVHELGHTLGLDHCPRAGCLMEDAKGKVSTVDGEKTFCEVCRKTLGGVVR